MFGVTKVTEWIASLHVARAGLAVLVVWVLHEFGNIESAIAHGDDKASLLLFIAMIVALSALISSIAGFAFSALAGSAFAYLGLEPVHAVQTMVVCSTAIQLYAVWKIRASIRWLSLWPMAAAGAVTIPLGVRMLLHLNGAVYAVGLGAFLTAYGCYAVFRRGTRVVRGGVWRDVAVGALGGLAGGLAGLPGLFVTIWCSMRGWDRLQQRAVYQPYILVMQLVTIVWLRWETSTDMHVTQDLRFVPFALLGAIGGLALFQRMSNKQFQAAVSALLMLSGIGLLSRLL
ncbi:MAG TPA: sulfite exporter TauE/SafE family protein [Casimicrobiaceae bacterium]|nr:sulfite exporter TauE/SafE family protein [Casimicrobiaceae bacterium]